MFDSGYDDGEGSSCPPKAYPASARQIDYLWNLAEREGMDAESLASIHCKKDIADLTEDEVGDLIAVINEDYNIADMMLYAPLMQY